MQIGRMFEIVYLLLERKVLTAGELAERFEVSTRTIYRDVEALAQAGIPIYAERGHGGGIRLTENFVLSKAALSEDERREVISALRSVKAAGAGETGAALGKLSALLGGENEDWLEVDFSAWDPDSPVTGRFQTLKEAIFARKPVSFRYSAADGTTRARTVEPAKLVFRGWDWYLLAWCRVREDWRYFKLSRMDEPVPEEETFPRRPLPKEQGGGGPPAAPTVELTAEIGPELAYRVLDEFPPDRREALPGGGYRVRMRPVVNEWLYEYLLTFGGTLRVVEPEAVRGELLRRHRAGAEKNGH